MDAIFHEDKFPYKSKDSGGEETEILESSQPNQEASSSQPLSIRNEEHRRSKRARVEKDFGPDYLVYNVEGSPITLEEALSLPDSDLWKEAINDEIESLMANRTRKRTKSPPATEPTCPTDPRSHHPPFLSRPLSRQGPLFLLLLGSVQCVVVSTPELAKEFLKSQDT
ncbi:hypothetical protein RJ639_038606 [Escallonia herrerae]|uniref:Uncharacterized protein n=1 Tax=Escallonia herrerae TaxID=1293975 RepID=A0AA88WXB6_9ASTE|nr:hypothetical protein RJ639_038606 [Escallonia herrerae]